MRLIVGGLFAGICFGGLFAMLTPLLMRIGVPSRIAEYAWVPGFIAGFGGVVTIKYSKSGAVVIQYLLGPLVGWVAGWLLGVLIGFVIIAGTGNEVAADKGLYVCAWIGAVLGLFPLVSALCQSSQK